MCIYPNWPLKNIRSFTTLRTCGNLADHVGDDPALVKANREKLRSTMTLPSKPIWLKQTHSTRIICLDDTKIETPPDADASFTTKPNTICAVLTADCLPILLTDKNETFVAAIHAGWQGLAAGIIESSLAAILAKTSISKTDIFAWFGPAIGPNAFQVRDDVRQKFLGFGKEAEAAFVKINDSQWLADIYLLAKQRLNKLGINKIFGGEYCTFTEEEKFFSYRRDGNCGRMASIIYRIS